MNTKLYCPIRGLLNVDEKDKSGLSFTEERQRIELVKFLLNKKKYPKELFQFEYIIKIGTSNQKLRADLVIWKDEKKEKVEIIAEVKKNGKHKEKAAILQLEPGKKLLNAKYGIYFDDENNYLLYNNDKYSITKLPDYGFDFDSKKIAINDLREINNIDSLYSKLDQLAHNKGFSKEKRYEGIFQVILAKYYDEKYNSKNLKFISNKNTFKNFTDLYTKSMQYYNISSQIELNSQIILSEDVINKIVEVLEEYSFMKSDIGVIQTFFMKFGANFLKKDLAQYYTPIPIIKFIASLIDVKSNNRIIDPAGGSGDFLVGILEKYKNSDTFSLIKENLHYWDLSEDALKVAFINMVLHGDGRTNIEQLDSIERFDYKNNSFDYVITNPPFGSKTKWDGSNEIMKQYKIVENEKANKELGILFIERSIKLLKENGILIIILPSGYMNNSSMSFIRNYCLKYRIIADISLPPGAFKGADTGVKTDILIIKKEILDKDYKIFVEAPKKIGFDFKSNKLSIMYKRDEKTGSFLYDDQNDKIIDSDLTEIENKFKKFTYDNSIKGFEQKNNDVEYSTVLKSQIVNDAFLTLKPELYLNNYVKLIEDINQKGAVSLKELKQQNKCKIVITNSKSIELVDEKEYTYISISESKKGYYSLENKMRSWEISQIDRAKQKAEENDIFISYLYGSKDKFFIMTEKDADNIVVTNGMYKIKIDDERIRLSFYIFLFTEYFSKQFEAFATGHIQTNINIDKVWEFKFNILNDEEFEAAKKMLKSQIEWKNNYNEFNNF
ncbi:MULTISPECIES: N-6 DNA methylase [Mesoplasma]|nr:MULTISPECIES: N-6 DNA methylase [Mesoplasma]